MIVRKNTLSPRPTNHRFRKTRSQKPTKMEKTSTGMSMFFYLNSWVSMHEENKKIKIIYNIDDICE